MMSEMRTGTLQNLCLEVIVSNFNWYYEVYCSTEDSCLKSEFEFLKKKYSFLILQKLKDKRRLRENCVDFLINRYLKVLDTRWLKQWRWDAIYQRLAEIGPNLEEITCFGYKRPLYRFNGQWEEVLCYLPNLKIVTYRHYCTDEFLLSLSKFCKCVETLDINCSKNVSCNGLMHFFCKDNDKNIHSLHAPIKELSIDCTNVEVEDIANVLKNMPFLEKITHFALPDVLYSMHKSDINAFDKVKPYNLTHLDLHSLICNSSEFTNIFTVCVFLCPHIKSLSCWVLQKDHLDLCSQLQELEELDLSCRAEDPLDLNELLTLNGKKLKSLEIYNFCMSLSILAQNCPKLMSLEMWNVILQHNCNDSVPVFHNLKKVVIKNFILIEPVRTQAVACLLSSAPNLNRLYLKNCDPLSYDIKIQILRCCEQCKLNVIGFSNSGVELLKDILLTCSTLQTLILERNEVMHDDKLLQELFNIAYSLPNRPKICVDDRNYLYDDNGVYIASDAVDGF